jgi:battenin
MYIVSCIQAYKILSFMYQIGLTISRSSMYCFKIEKWHILTIIQGLNLAGWFVLAAVTTGYIYVEFGWMVWVGLMGGCSYVNIYYFTLELNKSLQIE